ncbi:MAG: signal recognition particle protein, partial [Bacteroidota bacterium]
ERMAQRILGMGDIVSLVERAQDQFDEDEAKRLEKKIKKNKFDFNDFLGQLAQLRRMGDIKSLLGMIPGMNKMTRNLDIDNSAFTRVESMIQSMTPEERANPELLSPSRKKRIARGSGHSMQDVNAFIKQFDQMRKMMHKLSKNPAAMAAMPGMGGAGGPGRMKRGKRRR